MNNCKNYGANSFKDNKCNYCGTIINKPLQIISKDLTDKEKDAITLHLLSPKSIWLPNAFNKSNE